MTTVQAAAAADTFSDLVRAEGRGLWAAAYVIVGDAARAEELVQDAFEKAYARWHRVSALDRPGAWVRRVVVNAAISDRRTTTRRALQAVGPARDTSSDAHHDEDLWRAVRDLPDDQRRAVVLRYAADLPLEDVAADLGLSTTAANSVLYRARAALRRSPLLTESEVAQ